MSELHRIAEAHSSAAPPELLFNECPARHANLPRGAAVRIEPGFDLGALDAVVDGALMTFRRYDTAMDRAIALDVHAALPICRRTASDRRMWAWLGIEAYPDLVAWRWKPNDADGSRTRDRFSGSLVRQTFARLWWAVELTKGDDGSRELTERMLGLPGFQDVYETIFGRSFCQYRPALEAFVEVVGERPEAVVRMVAKEFGYLTTTLLLEAMSREEIAEELERLVLLVEARDPT